MVCQVNVCWQCGDIGFKDALVYCTKCRSVPRHSYCMDELPEDLTAEISWLCEGCRIKPHNSIRQARFPKTSPRILGHGSRRATIGPNGPCQGIDSVNDHLVNPLVLDPISSVRIDLSVNMDSHASYDIKNETLGSIIGGALGTVTPSSCFKLNENRTGESGNEKSGRKSLMPQHKDKLDKSLLFVDTLGTEDQFVAKQFPDNSVQASNMQLIERTLNRDNNGLGAGVSSSFFGLKEDEIQEFGRWKLKGRRAKRKRLILPSKDKLVNFYPLIDGKGTNSFADRRIPGTVSSSSRFKLNGERMEECWSEKPEGKSLILRDRDKADKPIPPFNLQGTNIQFAAEILLPLTSVEASDAQIIEQTSDTDIGGLRAGKTSPFFGLKEDEIEVYVKGKLNRSLVLPSEKELVNFHPLVDGESTNNSFAVKRIPGIEPFSRDIIGQTTSSDTNTLSAVRSSACSGKLIPQVKGKPAIDGEYASASFAVKSLACTSIEPFDNKSLISSSSYGTCSSDVGPSACLEFEQGQVEERSKEKQTRSRLVTPGMNVVDAVQPPIESQGTSIKFVAKRFSDSSIEASENQGTDALGGMRSSSCLRPREGESKDDETSPKRMIPPVKCERDNLQPLIYQQGTSIIFSAKRIPGIFVEVTDGQIIGGTLACDTLCTIKSSACFELEEAEIDIYGEEKPGSRRLNLKTEDDLNSLHPVTDSRGTRFKFTDKRLPDTSVAAFDRQIIGRTDVEDQMKFPFQQTFHAEPMVSHVWSGSFNISKGEFGPLRAHLSSRSCEKVCNFARKLPLVLHMQKLPRLVAWPNSFKISPPTDDNVALYFSPETIRVETVLDELVDDLINNDLMLKFQFDEVELLVFSSFVLPQDHQRFYGKYYAWGVFKRRSAQVCNVPAGSQAAPKGVAEGYQVDNSLKPAERIVVNNHVDILLKDSAQEINDFVSQSLIQPKEEIVTVTADSLNACHRVKLQAHDCVPSMYSEHLRYSEEERRNCERKLPRATQGQSIYEKCTLELKDVGEERIERDDMANSRGRSKDLVGCVGRRIEPRRPHNVGKFIEAKQHSTVLSNNSRKVNSGMLEGESLDSDNSTVTKLAAEQQSLLKQPAEFEKVGERMLGYDIQKKLPEILPDTEEGEVCDDGCFDDSQNGEPPCLELFPLRVENMGITFRFRAIKEDNELKLGLGLPTFGNHRAA